MLKGFALGVLCVLAAGLIGGYLVVSSGVIPANADAKPGAVEKWIARKSLKATIRRGAPTEAVPVPETEANLIAGVRLYARNCAVCHGAADAKPSNVAVGLYQRAPQLAKHGVEDDPEGETYWIIYHGVRMTGMPSFAATLSKEDIWKLALFLKRMDSLPPAAEKAWKAVPSQGA